MNGTRNASTDFSRHLCRHGRPGDHIRLADTELFIEVEKDFTTYGEEVKFGGGKAIRDGMGQSQRTRAEGAVDTVITNAQTYALARPCNRHEAGIVW